MIPEPERHIPAACEVCHIPAKLALFLTYVLSDGFKPPVNWDNIFVMGISLLISVVIRKYYK